jgi:hypothetical protein
MQLTDGFLALENRPDREVDCLTEHRPTTSVISILLVCLGSNMVWYCLLAYAVLLYYGHLVLIGHVPYFIYSALLK